MLKAIRSLWEQDESVMLDAVHRMAQMVADVQVVFGHGWGVCVGATGAEEAGKLVDEHDREVNRGEREVRRLIVGHLSINPGQDVAGCVAALLMAKDIERAGDHACNIYEVGARNPGKVKDFKYFTPLSEIQWSLGEALGTLRQAVSDSSDTTAREAIASYQDIKGRVKSLQKELHDADLGGSEAASSALLARYLMRINAHIGNAVSGIIFPVENIDFVSRGLRKEEKDR